MRGGSVVFVVSFVWGDQYSKLYLAWHFVPESCKGYVFSWVSDGTHVCLQVIVTFVLCLGLCGSIWCVCVCLFTSLFLLARVGAQACMRARVHCELTRVAIGGLAEAWDHRGRVWLRRRLVESGNEGPVFGPAL